MPRNTRAVLIVALSLVTGACSSVHRALVIDKPPPRVSMKGYQIDLEYGTEAPAQLAAIVEQPTALALAAQLSTTIIEIPADEEQAAPSYPAAPPPPPPSPCPDPGPEAVAERPISTDVKTQPEVGVYRFKQSGTMTLAVLKTKVDGLTTRTIGNVRPNALGGFDYDVDFTIGGLVKQSQQLRVVPASAASVAQPAAAGIQLIALKLQTPSGSFDFTPVAPVTIFTLPATETATITGAGVDPAHGVTMAVQGTINRKDRIEGCGEVVDGWTADATWTFVRAGQTPVVWTYSYTVATQHGGIVVGDHLKTTDTIGGIPIDLDVTSAIGSVHPK